MFDKASMSLSTVLHRQESHLRPVVAAMSTGFMGESATVVRDEDHVAVLLETAAPAGGLAGAAELLPGESLVPLSETILSGELTLGTARRLIGHDSVKRVQTKKLQQMHLDAALGDVELLAGNATHLVEETGIGVLVGIVDSGFDLSHPMFRDPAGRLRVEGLLDQSGPTPRAYTTAELETGWQNGANPGADRNGHGTHVASIAGGTKLGQFEGVAPGARFLLVKTNFRDTSDGLSWIFSQAGPAPCVVNMSLGTHLGSHDGSSAEELLIDQLSGPGKVVVISAGNDRQRGLHVGGWFLPSQIETVAFDVPVRQRELPLAELTLWYSPEDDFTVTLVTPTGQRLTVPLIGNIETYSSSSLDIEIGRQVYTPTNLIQVQIVLSFRSLDPAPSLPNGWSLQLACNAATIGRLDAWFANDGFGSFRPHRLVEEARTVAMSATARSCISVASQVSKNAWSSDDGPQQDLSVLVGQSSPFSSRGPTRDGRQKPDVSAPGQYLTAALAAGSSLANLRERALNGSRLLTIEGTSMAAPVVTGIVALMLQKSPMLAPDRIREILAASARVNAHGGTEGWNPTFGHGKVTARSAIDLI